MTRKSNEVTARTARFAGRRLDARYLGFFDSFNRHCFYEAHDVLEDLWLVDRDGPDGAFYKGLIQLAGAFVLLQKNRLLAADRVFGLAEANLRRYPSRHRAIELGPVLAIVSQRREELRRGNFGVNPLAGTAPPVLLWPDETDPLA
jgi:predicted metal-dependent hydrolase